MKPYNRIVFVAESGTCRAPMAARYFSGIFPESSGRSVSERPCGIIPGTTESEGRSCYDKQWH